MLSSLTLIFISEFLLSIRHIVEERLVGLGTEMRTFIFDNPKHVQLQITIFMLLQLQDNWLY